LFPFARNDTRFMNSCHVHFNPAALRENSVLPVQNYLLCASMRWIFGGTDGVILGKHDWWISSCIRTTKWWRPRGHGQTGTCALCPCGDTQCVAVARGVCGPNWVAASPARARERNRS